MLFAEKDFELLKLICWCKNIPAGVGSNITLIFPQAELDAFVYYGLAAKSRDGKSFRPRPVAYRLLEYEGYNFQSDIKMQTKQSLLDRRIIGSQVLFTFYRASVQVFIDKLDLEHSSVYMASFAARRSDPNNPFGSTRYYGIYCTSHTAFLVFHVDNGGVYFQKEITLFNGLIERTGVQNSAIIFMGNSTSSIASKVFPVLTKSSTKDKTKIKTDSFEKVFISTTLPVHFVPIGDAGAQLLKFLQFPNYREEVARAVMGGRYKPPLDEIPDSDTVHFEKPYNPAVVAIDMDVKRIDRALDSAQKRGFEKIAIYALQEQIPFLESRYENTGNADIMKIPVESLKQKIGSGRLDLYEPSLTPYSTKNNSEGRYINVSDIASYREVGE